MSASLHSLLRQTCKDEGCSMADLTVLAPGNDPFRQDTPGKRRASEWLVACMEELGCRDRSIHLRGLHYLIAMAAQSVRKPDGHPYRNNFNDWTFLKREAAKAARWLGFIPWDQIRDNRNKYEHIVRTSLSPYDPDPYVSCGVHVEIEEDLEPQVGLLGFEAWQPYRLVIFGEKSSLAYVLEPISTRFETDLYLPTGEISDTLIQEIAENGAEDGRPLVVVTVSDCDPAGWQMPISIGRKLQAFKAIAFPELEFRVVRGGLTPDQVRTYSLPEAPIKESEKRAERWTECMGVEQTEIDTVVVPDKEHILHEILEGHIAPYFDGELRTRCMVAKAQWMRRAQQIVDADGGQFAELREQAEKKLAELQDEIARINDALRLGADEFGFDLQERFGLPPVPDLPEPTVSGEGGEQPLIDSREPFAEQCRRLIASRQYKELE